MCFLRSITIVQADRLSRVNHQPLPIDLLLFGNIFDTSSTGLLKALNDEIAALAKVDSWLNAANRTMDKYAGALEAGDLEYAGLQMARLLDFIAQYNQAASDLEAAIKAFQAALASEPGLDLAGTSANELTQLQDYVRTNGMPNSLTDPLLSLGLSQTAVNDFQAQLLALDVGALYRGASNNPFSAGVPQLFSIGNTVPEPSSLLLFLAAGLGLLFSVQRRFDLSAKPPVH